MDENETTNCTNHTNECEVFSYSCDSCNSWFLPWFLVLEIRDPVRWSMSMNAIQSRLFVVAFLGFIAAPAHGQDDNPLAFLTQGATLDTGYLHHAMDFGNGVRLHAIIVDGAVGKDKAILFLDPNVRTFNTFGE